MATVAPPRTPPAAAPPSQPESSAGIRRHVVWSAGITALGGLLFGAVAGALPAGRIADRIGRRPTVLGTAAVFTASVRRGQRNSCWPLNGSHYWPCTHRDRVATTLPKSAAERMVL